MVNLFGKRRELRFEWAINFYVDESSQTGLKYLVMGCLAARQKTIPNILQNFAQLRHENNFKSELKWKKVSNEKFPFYEAWLEAFFQLVKGRFVRFSALVVDTSLFDHRKYNEGDGDIGFNKLLYQLILHRVGRRYLLTPLYGYLDKRATRHTPENLRKILNAGLAKHYDNASEPFQRLQFMNSADSDFIQTVDILIGAIAYFYNDHGSKPGAREAKKLLSENVMLHSIQHPYYQQFNIWEFEFKRK